MYREERQSGVVIWGGQSIGGFSDRTLGVHTVQAGFLLVSELFNVVVRSMLRFQDVAELLHIGLITAVTDPGEERAQEPVHP